MNEIKCPSCQKAFKVDEAGFADILKQVRDSEFSHELQERVHLLEKEKESAVRLAEEKTKNELQTESAKKNAELAELKSRTEVRLLELEAEKELMLSQLSSRKDAELAELKAKMEGIEAEKRSAIDLATEKTRSELAADLAKSETALADLKARSDARMKELAAEKDAETARLKAEKELAVVQLESRKDAEVAELKVMIKTIENEHQMATTQALHLVEKQRDELASELRSKETEKLLLESSLKDKYETELKSKDEMIAYYKDMKAKLSTKMVGETLEQHCEYEFERLRATGFKNATFGKDNDASSGSKGDYLYREFDDAGNEVISIMFEMKNEGDETASKKRNEDFLRELDKDRIEKSCEYAVLVTLLEADSELYNSGIVDVSHKHDKMYVVRPQFFIPIITVLRNAALNSMRYKSELALIRSQNIDITTFESDLQLFQDGFMKNVKDSSSKFIEAMDGIDATIKKLENIKEALRLSNKHLLTAGSKVETVSIKRLTHNNPTMAEKFRELKTGEEAAA